MLEYLELDPLGAPESPLVLAEIVVEPAGAAQVADEPAGVGNRGQAHRGTPGLIEPRALAGAGRERRKALAEGAASSEQGRHVVLGVERQTAAGRAAHPRDIVGLRMLWGRAEPHVGLECAAGAGGLEYLLGRGDPHAEPEHASATVRSRLVVRASTTISPRVPPASAPRPRRHRAVGSRARAAGAPVASGGGRGVDLLLEADVVVFDQPPGGFDDVGRAAIVVRQRDPLEPRIGEVELEDPAHAGPAPSVQGLVLVAHAEEAILGRREDPYEQLLRRLDVLVLVDENLTEAALPAPAKIVVVAQRADCAEHEVIEVVDWSSVSWRS